MSEGLLRESPEEFCQNLVTYIHPSVIVVGSNFTYGVKAAGNTDTMKAFMADYDIPVEALTFSNDPAGRRPSAAPSSDDSFKWGTWRRLKIFWGAPLP